MKLSVKERYLLRSVFKPDTTNLLYSDLWDEIMNKIKVTSEEENELGMIVEGQNILWDESKEKPFELELSDIQVKMLKQAVRDKDDAKRIPYDPDDKTAVLLAKKILKEL